MEKQAADPQLLQARVLKNTFCGPDVLEMVLEFPAPVSALPGQYGMFETGREFLLRRAFSVGYRIDEKTYAFFIKIRGKATAGMAVSSLETMNVFFPLGKGFPAVNGRRVLLIGGGCGVFPLIYLAKELAGDNRVTLLYGVNRDQDLILLDRFPGLAGVHLYSEQGESGKKGRVTDFFPESLPGVERFDRYYVCGPKPMAR
ncbi:MAG: hypothetical protein PHQ23_08585, partial [Candidatus Wallbacteria bacterium]|nr:hypothetical protein [Candidatus Wallbacteria bacterium]